MGTWSAHLSKIIRSTRSRKEIAQVQLSPPSLSPRGSFARGWILQRNRFQNVHNARLIKIYTQTELVAPMCAPAGCALSACVCVSVSRRIAAVRNARAFASDSARARRSPSQSRHVHTSAHPPMQMTARSPTSMPKTVSVDCSGVGGSGVSGVSMWAGTG